MKEKTSGLIHVILILYLVFVLPLFGSLCGTEDPAHAGNVVTMFKAQGGGTPAGTLLLGNNNVTTSSEEFNGNPDTAYEMCHAAAATGTIAKAYFYDRNGYETPPVHICVWTSAGVLVGCSGAVAMGATPATWVNANWSGPTLTQGVMYCIGIVNETGAGFWTNYDTSSPAIPGCDATAMTYGSETNATLGACNNATGSYSIYVTN